MTFRPLSSLAREVTRVLRGEGAIVESGADVPAAADIESLVPFLVNGSLSYDRLRTALLPVLEEVRWARTEAASEVEWHRKALEGAEKRAGLLEHHLTVLADILGEGGGRNSGGPPPEAAPSELGAAEADGSEAAPLAIYCFGAFRVRRAGEWIGEWSSLRGQAILRYLAMNAKTAVSRDTLMEIFWPEADVEAARRNLHQAIYSLRQTLRMEPLIRHPILLENGRYRLNPELDIWIDAEEFEGRIRVARAAAAAGARDDAAREFAAALELYAGHFLDADGDEWALSRREALRSAHAEAADWLTCYFYDRGEYSAAIATCQRLIELDRCNEHAHCHLMRCYAAQGQRTTAIRQYHACMQALRDELGVNPSEKTQKLFTGIIREAQPEVTAASGIPQTQSA
jgi:DNA-binding SARP family transcriptional activator